MTIQWGAWEYSGGNGMRVGIDVSTSAVSNTSTTVTFTYKIYTENQYVYSDPQTLSYGGVISGSTSFTNSSGSGSSGGGAVLRATKTYTYTYSGSSYGTSPGSVSASANLSGAYNGVTPSASVSTAIPARPFAAPAAPSGVTATRNSDAQITLTWTRNATSSKPYTSQTIQMQTYTGSAWGAWVTVATASATATSYVKTGLSTNAVYRFQIKASNSVGSSAYVASGYIYMTPAAPSGAASSLDASGSTITTTWTNNAYAETNEKITVERSVNGAAFTVLTSTLAYTATSYVDNAPGAGSNQYRVKVTQTLNGLASGYSTGNTVTTIVPPLAPTNLAPNGINADLSAAVTLTWQHNPGGDGAPQSAFTIDTSSDGGTTWVTRANNVASSTSSWTMPGGTLTNGTAYQWRVRTIGITSGGYGPNSSVATLTGSSTPTITLTNPPTTTTALPLSVSWTYAQAQGSAQSQWWATLYAADGVTVLETQHAVNAATSVTFAYPAQDATSYVVAVQVSSAAGLLSTVATKTTTVSLPVPAAATIDATYQPCTGSVVLHVEGANPAPVVANRLNSQVNPAFRTTSGTTEVRRNLAQNPAFRGASAAGTQRTNYCTNPQPTSLTGWSGGGSGASLVTAPWDATRKATSQTANGSSTHYMFSATSSYSHPVGDVVTVSAMIQVPAGKLYRAYVHVTTGNVYYGSPPTVLSDGNPKRVSVTATLTAAATDLNMAVLVYDGNGATLSSGAVTYMGDCIIERERGYLGYFDGGSPATGLTFSWSGTANASASLGTGLPDFRRNYVLNPGMKGSSGNAEIRRNQHTNPTFRAAGASTEMRRNYAVDPKFTTPTSWNGVTAGSPATISATQIYSPNVTAAVGDTWTVGVDITNNSTTTTLTGVISVGATTAAAFGANPRGSTAFSIPPSTTQRVTNTFTLQAGADGLRILISSLNITGGTINKAQMEKIGWAAPYFDGTTAAADGLTYSWTGTANASASIASGKPVTGWSTFGDVKVWQGADGASARALVGTPSPLLYPTASTPMTPSDPVSMGAFVTGATGQTAQLDYEPFDSGGTSLGLQSGTPTGTGAVEVRLSRTGTNVANTASGKMYVRFNTSGLFTVRFTQLEKTGAVASYFDGSYQSLVGDLGFTSVAWTGAADASPSVWQGPALTGFNQPVGPGVVYRDLKGGAGTSPDSAKLWRSSTGTITWDLLTAPIGTASGDLAWTAQLDYMCSNPANGASLVVTFLNASYAVVNSYTTALAGAMTWQTANVSYNVPAGAVMVQVQFVSTAGVTGDYCSIDHVLVERGSSGTYLPYFNGDSAAADGLTYSWAGVPYQSASVGRAPITTYQQARFGAYKWTDAAGKTWQRSSNSDYLYSYNPGVATVGKFYAAAFTIWGPPGRVVGTASTDNVVGGWVSIGNVTIPAEGFLRVSLPASNAAGSANLSVGISAAWGCAITDVVIEAVAATGRPVGGSYFDGSMPVSGARTRSWTGTVDGSSSIETAPAIATTTWTNGQVAGKVWQTTEADDVGGHYAEVRDTNISYSGPIGGSATGDYWAARVMIAPNPDYPYLGNETVRVVMHDGNNYITGNADGTDAQYTLMPTGETEVVCYSQKPITGSSLRLYVYPAQSQPVRIGKVLIEKVTGAKKAPGTYFDGATQDTSQWLYDWSGAADASTSTATSRAEAAVSSVIIERQVAGTDGWVKLVENMAVPNDFIDTVPVTNGINTYRVTSVSTAPSYRVNDPVDVAGTDGSVGDELLVFLAYGDAFQNVLRFRGNPSLGVTGSRVRSAPHFLGRKKPSLLVGANSDLEVKVAGSLRWDETCQRQDECRYDSPPTEWIQAALDAEVVCYRDYTGRRIFGMLSDVEANDGEMLGVGTLSFSVTQTEFTEAYGVLA